MAFPADGIIGFISADLNLLAAVDGFAVLNAKSHGSLAFAEPAYGLHLFDFVGVYQHIFAAFEQIVLEIIFETKGHHGNIKFVHYTDQLENTVFTEELALIN